MNEKIIWVLAGSVIGGLSGIVLKLTVPMPARLSLIAGAALVSMGVAVGSLIANHKLEGLK